MRPGYSSLPAQGGAGGTLRSFGLEFRGESMRLSPRLSGRAVARREGIKSATRRGAAAAGRFRAERLEGRLLLSAVGEQQGLELADLRPRALREAPLHRPGSVNSGAL